MKNENLNIEAEYMRSNLDVGHCTVDSAEKAIVFCNLYGAEICFQHKDGVVNQYLKVHPKGVN